MRTGARLSLLGFVAALALGAGLAAPYRQGAVFLVHATGMTGPLATVAGWESESVTRSAAPPVPWRGGSLRASAYRPAHATGRPIVLVPGVHAAGIEEPRFVGFANDLAAQGHPVLTVELPDLAHYAITPRTTDMIEDAVNWTLQQSDYRSPDGRIGLMGISFGGGLSVVAAGRPSLRGRVAFVMSLGGHADLPRTLRYLCTGIQPDGQHRPPHDYGLAIVLLGAADQVVPPGQAEPLRTAIRAFLEASRLDMVDKARAAAEFIRAKNLEAGLPEPSRTYMDYVNTRDVAKLGPVLVPHLSTLGGDPALSADESPSPACPVYLLHGTDDNVVPAIESSLLAQRLRSEGHPVHVLLTPLITHAEVDRSATVRAAGQLVSFWNSLLHE